MSISAAQANKVGVKTGMASWETYERVWFVLAFMAGIALCFVLPPILRDCLCALPTNTNQPAKSLICGEIKLTDLALIFFTYCLFLVGIFSALSSKHTLEELQRAHLWPGFGDHDPVVGGMKWFITVTNSGQTAGVIKEINYFVELESIFFSGGGDLRRFTEREDVILPSPPRSRGEKTSCEFVIDQPKICWGWIVYEDVFGRKRKRGWKHRLNLTADSAGNHSNPLPGCYSWDYQPWKERRAKRQS
jgi:hypothetical protein